jgi:hypothetical protein
MVKTPDPRPVALPAPPAIPLAADDEPGLSWDEYLDRRRELEARLTALAERFVTSQRFPRWLYHASLAARVVRSRAERDALGPGWHVRPG